MKQVSGFRLSGPVGLMVIVMCGVCAPDVASAQTPKDEREPTEFVEVPTPEQQRNATHMQTTYGHCAALASPAPNPKSKLEISEGLDCEPRGIVFRRVASGDNLSTISADEYGVASGYESIRRYHNTAVRNYLNKNCPLPPDLHDPIKDSNAIQYEKSVNGVLRPTKLAMPLPGTVFLDVLFHPPEIKPADDTGDLAGSGTMKDLIVAGQRCLAWPEASKGTLQFPPVAKQSYDPNGTLWGMITFCDPGPRVSAFTSSERQPLDSPNWKRGLCVKGVNARTGRLQFVRGAVELPIALDAVVVALNRGSPLNNPRAQVRDSRGTPYLKMSVKEVCGLLRNTSSDGYPRYYSSEFSGTLGFVGARLCGNPDILRRTVLDVVSRSENYEKNAEGAVTDPSHAAITILPYFAYAKFKDKLIAVAINGIEPSLSRTIPVDKAFSDPTSQNGSAPICRDDDPGYCLSRYLYVYADPLELGKRGKLYALLRTLVGAPTLLERLNYLPLPRDLRNQVSSLLEVP